jgi:hypothetical protein
MGRQKNRESDQASAVSGRHLPKQHNNQPKTVPAMGRVFETRFGRGRTFREDDYPSFWTAIRATKNEMKKYTPWL